jgi:hypothetical protein
VATSTLGFGLMPFGQAPFGDPSFDTPSPGTGGGPTAPDQDVADLEDFQYELDGYKFGLGCDLEMEPPFRPGTRSWNSQMSSMPRGGRRFGVDKPQGKTWSFDLFVNRANIDMDNTAAALQTLEDGSRAWRASWLRESPGAVSVLRYRLGGRTRRVYGRPANWAEAPENRLMSGFIPVSATFETVDDLHYDDVQQSAPLSLQAATVGGFTAPFTTPIVTSTSRSARQGIIVITGDEPTWVTVRFSGPVDDPLLRIGGLAAGLRGTVSYDEVITIDPSPWALSTTRQDGASAAGRLTRSTVLTRMRLEPGAYEAIFTGSDPTGRARATVSWRAARSSL